VTGRLRLLALVAPLVGCSGCAIVEKTDVPRLLTSGRDGYQHPERVIEALGLREGDRVAEIGAGDGYWLPWLSAAVGPQGRVYAVEVENDLTDALLRRVARKGLANVEVVRGEYDDPKLPDGGIDLAMTCLTYHHIEERIDYFARLRADLSPSGRVAHLDDRHDVGPPLRWLMAGHWSDPDAIRTEMAEAGYRRTVSHEFLPVQSFQVFEPSAGRP